MTQDELFERLCGLTKRWNEHDDIPKSQKLECRDIGRKLEKLGGVELMREAYYYAREQNRNIHYVQACWDGIGDWLW
jgi:hypothetical protein